MQNNKTFTEKISDEMAEKEALELEPTEAVNPIKRTLTLEDLHRKQMTFYDKVKNEEKVDVSVAPQYCNEFSNNMRVTINGISIFIPIDGKTYRVPKTFADEIARRVRKVNQKLNRFKQKGNGAENTVVLEEKSIGEVKFY